MLSSKKSLVFEKVSVPIAEISFLYNSLQNSFSDFLMAEIISLTDFKKTELKVAKILSVEDIAGKDRLYKLEIDVGEEKPRTLFAGIKQFYAKEQLVGKSIIVVANLQPRKIGALESQGMLLAAQAEDGSFALLTVEKAVKPGTPAE